MSVSQDSIVRTIAAVKKAGIEVRSIRVEPDGAVIINGDNHAISSHNGVFTEKELEESAKGFL